jgi:hypothetical protein
VNGCVRSFLLLLLSSSSSFFSSSFFSSSSSLHFSSLFFLFFFFFSFFSFSSLSSSSLSSYSSFLFFFFFFFFILLIFDSNHTNIQIILDDFNTIHPSRKFTAEMETNSTINYLDITIHRTPTGWRTTIYRKPTFTDTIIPYTSNHPTQHKYAAIKFYTTV